ncbi:MAG: PDZ domain-containing protein [Clostridia bacterium]|nr:PDZ domain-containing protein [Clostridia bacterium]
MHKKISVGLCITCVILSMAIAAAVTVPVTLFVINNKIGNLSKRQVITAKIEEIDAKVRANFLYDIDDAELIDSIAEGYMKGLEDDYAAYFDNDDYSDKIQTGKGYTDGIGIEIAKHPDSGKVTVLYVDKNSPANKSGIKKGDVITHINDTDIKDKSVSECVEMIGNEIGKSFKLTLSRGDTVLNVNAAIAEYEADTVRYQALESIGYIKITKFNQSTPKQFEEAIKYLNEKKVSALIFDLRDNLGGDVAALVAVMDDILPSGDLIKLKYKNGETKVTEKSDSNEISLPMAVLVNANSASCSEIFAMNIRDYKKGKLIGTKTYGKGIVQSTYELTDKTAIKFTVATVVDKNGVSYHGVGLTPDVEVKLNDEQQRLAAFLNFETDPQYKAAVSAVTRR